MDSRWNIQQWTHQPKLTNYNAEQDVDKNEEEPKSMENKGVFTLEELESHLFEDGFDEYTTGLELFKKDDEDGKLAIVPIIKENKTIIGISTGESDDSMIKVNRNLDRNAREILPLYVYDGIIKRSRDIAYMMHKFKKGYYLTSIKEYSEEELEELGIKFGQFYLSSITTSDIELLQRNEIKAHIDNKLMYYNNSYHVKNELEKLTESLNRLESEEDYVIYAPIIDKVVGMP